MRLPRGTAETSARKPKSDKLHMYKESQQLLQADGTSIVLPSDELSFANSIIWITNAASSHLTSRGAPSRIAAARFRNNDSKEPLEEGTLNDRINEPAMRWSRST